MFTFWFCFVSLFYFDTELKMTFSQQNTTSSGLNIDITVLNTVSKMTMLLQVDIVHGLE